MTEMTSAGFAACYRGLQTLSEAMHEWMGVCLRAKADIWLPDGPIARIQQYGTDVEVFLFEDKDGFHAWEDVLAGGVADERFRYIRLCPPLNESTVACLQRFESFGRSMPVDDPMARRVEQICKELAATLRQALLFAA